MPVLHLGKIHFPIKKMFLIKKKKGEHTKKQLTQTTHQYVY